VSAPYLSILARPLTSRRLAAIQRISMRCWLIGIVLSIGSSSASLVKLRADGRRFALTQAAARKENTEKSPEEKVRAEEERREKGRALLACVLPLRLHVELLTTQSKGHPHESTRNRRL